MEFEAKTLIDYIQLTVNQVAETDLNHLLMEMGDLPDSFMEYMGKQRGKPFDPNGFSYVYEIMERYYNV